jgi:magnesium transporter
MGTIASGTVCAFLSGAFEATLAQAITIAFFLPLVLGLNESVAMQSMSLSLQALHSSRKTRLTIGSLRRELATSFLLALGAAVVSGIIAVLWRKSIPSAIVLAATLLASLVFAGVIGFSIPLVLRLGQRDPKIAAGPIALAIVDLLALLFYFTLAKLTLS